MSRRRVSEHHRWGSAARSASTRALCVLVAVCTTALFAMACGDARQTDGGPHPVARVKQEPLAVPGQTPFPCSTASGTFGQNLWNGTRVQLMLADAMLACMGGPDSLEGLVLHRVPDETLSAVVENIRPLAAPFATSFGWNLVRSNLVEDIRNCDPATGEILPDPVPIDSFHIQEKLDISSVIPEGTPGLNPSAALNNAKIDLRWPAFNLCLAQQLRRVAPGAAGGEALFFSRAEQRELLETIRERAQISMLGYSLLASAFATPGLTGTDALLFLAGPQDNQRIPFLQAWAQQVAEPERLQGMGQDFAAAVQLHLTVTRELAELLARSRSSGEPHRPAQPPSDDFARADDVWGRASWQQRQLALMFGGDPLAQEDGGPWQHPLGITAPGKRLDLSDRGWPTQLGLPYVRKEATDPQVWRLAELAKGTNQLRFDLRATGPSSANCAEIRVDSSADKIYRAVERELRELNCDDGDSREECQGFPDHDSKTFLWQTHRINRDHAHSLVALYRDLLGPRFGRPDSGGDTSCRGQYGAMNLAGRIEHPPGGRNRLWLSGDTTFEPKSLQERGPRFTPNAPLRMATADNMNPFVVSDNQGFAPLDSGTTDEFYQYAEAAKRRMGAISALHAVRRALLAGMEHVESGDAVEPFFAVAPQMVDVIDAAIGGQGFSLEPVVQPFFGPYFVRGAPELWSVEITADPSDPFWGSDPESPRFVLAFRNGWVADMLAGGQKTEVFPDELEGGQIQALIDSLPEGHASFLLPFGSRRWGTFDGYGSVFLELEAPTSGDRYTFVACKAANIDSDCSEFRLLAADVEFQNDPFLIHDTQHLAWGGALGDWIDRQWTPLPQNPTEPSVDGFGLPSNWVPPFNAELVGGSALESSAGYFMDLAESTAKDATSAVRTAMDNLIRQLDVEFEQKVQEAENETRVAMAQQDLAQAAESLCGSGRRKCDATLTSRQLDLAWYGRSAELIDGLEARIRAEHDAGEGASIAELCEDITMPPPPEADLPAITVDNAGSVAKDFLCIDRGDDEFKKVASLFKDRGDASVDADAAGRTLDCMVWATINDVFTTDYLIADRVVAALDEEPGVPAFDDYAGGELQSVFIEQWRAIQTLDEHFAVMIRSTDAARAAMDETNTLLVKASRNVQRACGGCSVMSNTLQEAAKGFAVAGPIGAIAGGLKGLFGTADQCEKKRDKQDLALADALRSRKDALSSVTSAMSGLVNEQTAIQQAAAAVQSTSLNARLAQARHQLEIDLIEQIPTQRTSFGLFREYRNFDLFRAKALVDNARRHAVAARRALEARYVVDLSTLVQPEPFVASPSTWADEVYEYDLSLPAAVGLTVGDVGNDGIFVNKVEDYVNNLRAFTSGFSVFRPTAVARDEIDVVTLPGLSTPDPDLVEILIDEDTGETADVVVYPGAPAWNLECPVVSDEQDNQTEWVPPPPPQDGGVLTACLAASIATSDMANGCDCGDFDGPECWVPCLCDCGSARDIECVGRCGELVRPLAARLSFSLDPWGRLNDFIMNEPFEQRYNARYDRLAVNFVGTGVKDCERADDPLGCYNEGFIRYDLEQLGQAWVTDFDGDWHALGVPTGRIEGGKALAAELWLDPLRDGWDTPFISAVARTEFGFRPLGGEYQIEFDAGPEVRLDRIERVQLLVGSSSWVVQQ